MTAQIHELLIYEGEETSMAFCPPIPMDHPRVKVLLELEEIRRIWNGEFNFRHLWKKKPKYLTKRILSYKRSPLTFLEWFTDKNPLHRLRRISKEFQFSTACWRCYQGKWEIRDQHFYLVDLKGRLRLEEGPPLFAEWFTGTLRIPKGERLCYVHMGFETVYEEEIYIKIENGIVGERNVVDNRDSPHSLAELVLKNLPGHENRFPGDEDN